MTINAVYSTVATATGAPLTVAASTQPTWVKVTNMTLFGYSGTSLLPLVSMADFSTSVSDSSTKALTTAATAPGVAQAVFSSNGISVGNSAEVATGSVLTITGITNASPAVVTTATAHGLQSGDVVWISSATGMQQIAQMPFTVTVLTSTTFELSFLDASGFASAATGGSCVQIMNYGAGIFPMTGVITKIIGGSTTQVQFSVAQAMEVGQMFTFKISSLFGGMLGLNQNLGIKQTSNLGGYEVISYNAATNTATFNVNSTGMGAFAFPSNAITAVQPAGIIQPAQAAPTGTYWSVLTNVGISNNSTQYILLGSSVCGRAGDTLLIEYGWSAN